MENKKHELTIPETYVLFSGFVALFLLVIFLNRPPFYDEVYYLKNIQLLKQFGFTNEYLLKHEGSAGPLYTLVHFSFEPLTKLQPPFIRFVNFAFLVATTYVLKRLISNLGFCGKSAYLIMAIPMTYVVGGLALTEMPAIFFLTLGIHLIILSNTRNYNTLITFLMLSGAGLSLSLAIIGRQPFLLIVAVLPILFFKTGGLKTSKVNFLVTAFFTLAIPTYIFYQWQGLVAPMDAAFYKGISDQGVSYRFDFFFICLAYFAIIILIIAPKFFLRPTKLHWVGLLLVTIVVVFVTYNTNKYSFLPFRFLLEKNLPKTLFLGVETLSSVFLYIGGFYFLITLLRHLVSTKFEKNYLFFVAGILLIALSCVKITWGFSSRYAAQAIPFLIPICANHFTSNRQNIIRLAVGVILGLISFSSFIIGS